MPLFSVNGVSVFFAHVPKTGGSSIDDYLFRRFGKLSFHSGSQRAGYRPPQSDMIHSPAHLSAADLEGLLPTDLAHSFAIVRSPLKRLLSEYRFQSNHSKVTRLGFSTWLRIMLSAVRLDQRVYENHIRPQTDLVLDGSKVFKFEDGFDPLITWLDEVTGTTAPDLDMGHFLKRKHAELPITREDLALIHEFYAVDYETFSYEKESPEDYPSDPYSAARNVLGHVLARLVIKGQKRHWLR